MDGNGRWAQQRGLPRTAGHIAGVQAVRTAIRACAEAGIEYLTLYSFSSENWRRPTEEVTDLMELLRQYLSREVPELHQNGVRIRFIGEHTRIPAPIRTMMQEAEQLTAHNTRITLILAISYGGQQEIALAVQSLARQVQNGALAPEALTEAAIAEHLYTRDIPNPDMVLRTSGEQRLSNFLLWQTAYSELLFLDVCWPDFSEEHLQQAVETFRQRERRYGGV
jgi:undecaprenyl diphosphate synthase